MTQKTSLSSMQGQPEFVYGIFHQSRSLSRVQSANTLWQKDAYNHFKEIEMSQEEIFGIAKAHLDQLSAMFLYVRERTNDGVSYDYRSMFTILFSNIAKEILFMPDGEGFLRKLQKSEETFPVDIDQQVSIYVPMSYERATQMLFWIRDKNFVIFCRALKAPTLTSLLENITDENLTEKADEARNWMSIKENQEYLMQKKELYLNNLNLTELPPEIAQFAALEILSVGRNKLTYLPQQVEYLTSLKILSIHENQLTHLPPTISNLTNLQEFYFQKNKLTSLPAEIGCLKSLQRLDLHDNSFQSWQKEIAPLKALENHWIFNEKTKRLSGGSRIFIVG